MQVISVDVRSGGFGYSQPPRVLFSGGGGSGAQATAQVVNGSVMSVTVTSGGFGYTSPPEVSFKTLTPGSGASASAQIG